MNATIYPLPTAMRAAAPTADSILRRLGNRIATLFASTGAQPRAVSHVAIELRAAAGTSLRVEGDDDVVTIYGAVLTIRNHEPADNYHIQKNYY